MFVEKCIFINRAPFEYLEIDFLQNGINVLSGINGNGKTTILSHIVDAFHEMAKLAFPNSYSGNLDGKFYRVVTNRYSLIRFQPSEVYIRFKHKVDNYDYIEIVGDITENEYNNINIENKITFEEVSRKLKDSSQAKILSKNCNKKSINAIFDNTILTYFPSYRFEVPGYLNEVYSDIAHDLEPKFSGYITNPIEIVSGLPKLANWLMDLVLDKRLYNDEKSNQLWHAMNTILRLTLLTKVKKDVRLGIGQRQFGQARVSIVHDKENDGGIEVIYPSIFEISSGEAALLCIFGEILHQSDRIEQTLNCEGIVLIDEVDKHLHITLQKEVLPLLFHLFPGIQFIISSHSPFLSMGLGEILPTQTRLIDLDNNGLVSLPQRTEIYETVYRMFISENNNFAEQLKLLKEEIVHFAKPIIITEGKTDIIHLLAAKKNLGIEDMDFDTIEANKQPEGDTNLLALLEQLGKVSRQNTIIGIFDRDNSTIIKALKANDNEVMSFGNNVYGFCITVPQSRIDRGQNNISIEYLYSDDEIKTILKNGCRLFFGTEFTNKSMRHNVEDLLLNLPKGKGEDKIIENNGGQAVYDKEDNNHLAKKIDFANAIADEEIEISKDSWNNFSPIFDTIKKILSTPKN